MKNYLQLDAYEASQEFREYLDQNPHLSSYRIVIVAYDQITGAIRRVSNTSPDQAEKMLELNRSEESRDLTKNYWDCFDSATQSFLRGYVSHFAHGDEVKYLCEFVENEDEAEETKKAFLAMVKKVTRIPPFTPEMIKVFNSEDFDTAKLIAEAEKFKAYKAMALEQKGVK